MLRINGEDKDAAGKLLLDYLREAGYSEQRIAVERNEAIVPKAEYGTVRLEDGDVIEIVSFVGGG